MNKRLFLAFGLFFVFMLVFQTMFMPKSEPGSGKGTSVTNRKPVPVTDRVNEPLTGEVERKSALPEVGNGLLSVGLNRIDGSVSSIRFLKYKEDGEPINFVERNIPFFRNFRVLFPGFAGAAIQPEAVFDYRKINNNEHRFTHTYKKGPAEGLRVVKTYKFYKDKYYFDLTVDVQNTGRKGWKNKYRDREYFSVVWGSPINWRKDKETTGTYDTHTFLYCGTDGDVKDTGDSKDNLGVVKWVGLKDRYFLLSVIPVEDNGVLSQIKNQGSVTNIIRGKTAVKTFSLIYPNLERNSLTEDARTMTYRVFLGPQKYDLLTADEFSGRNYSFENVFTSFPIVRQISILFEKLIFFIQGGIANFGIVILIVTLILKLALYPLTHKSAVSMKKMQLIQPKLNALKEQYKGKDPRMMNQKMMELYKQEGVNPMGGCLPLLLQLPIFIALYQVLPRLVDMKNVSFLWIKDLSSPDTLFTITAFKDIPLLPYHFNLLPLIMTGVSLFQQKFTQAKNAGMQSAQQAQQGKMMMMMPLMFLFLFWSMPSGLVLYWTVQNVLSIIEQHFINKKYDAQLAAAK